MSDASLALADLASKLAGVGEVRTGLAVLETTSADLPVVSIWSTEDRPSAEQNYCAPAYTRAFTVEVKLLADDAFGDAMDSVLTAIRTALKPVIGQSPLSSALALRETSARFYAPADNGNVAVVTVQYELDYLERFA